MLYGYSLPNEYFSRENNSNKKFKESCIDSNLTNERDIKDVFKKIKQFYNDDNTKDLPKDNSLLKERDAYKTTPAHGIDETADVITKEFLQRVSHLPQTLNKYFNPTQNTFHIVDGKTLSKITNSPLTSSKTLCNRFNFSRLDDGPKGKGSIEELDSSEEMLNQTCYSKIEEWLLKSNCVGFAEEVLDTTKKIVHLINKKEKEYKPC